MELLSTFQPFVIDNSLLAGLSFLVGILVGLTGVGGASLITPMLIFVFHIPPAVAVSSDVMAATLMKIVGGYKHWEQKTLDPQVVKWLTLGSVPGALFGVGILHLILKTGIFEINDVLLRMLGVTIVVVAMLGMGQLAIKVFQVNIGLPKLPVINLDEKEGRLLAIVIGVILGCLVGMTSVGSGSLFAIAMLVFFRLDSQKLVGTDIAQAAILLGFTALGHLALGTVNWSLVLPIWLGTVPGVLVGSRLCKLTPQKVLQFIIYTILIAVGWKLVNQA